MSAACWSGDGRPIKFIDGLTERAFCNICAASEITSSRDVHLQYIDSLIPFEQGERVECWTVAEFYDGPGTVVGVSTELQYGGTPINPAYLVKLDDQDELFWYTPVCLKRTRSEASA